MSSPTNGDSSAPSNTTTSSTRKRRNINWWAAQIKNLENKADPTHLPIYLSNDVLLQEGGGGCCVIGFHGTRATGYGVGNSNSNGNAVVQTFAWASWVRPGTYPRVAGEPLPTDWALQDIHALSHEISEWADDPFINDTVDPWLTPTAPQYGCTNILETGDPVVAIGFAMGTNTFEQGPLPDGEQMADGYYHPEDEVRREPAVGRPRQRRSRRGDAADRDAPGELPSESAVSPLRQALPRRR